MGLGIHGGTMYGALTPMCNKCGIALCWDIEESEAEENRAFWDAWVCQECNAGVPMSLKAWKNLQTKEK